MQLINSEYGSTDALLEYDAFGNIISQTYDANNENPFRFSTKYYDHEVGWYDFGHRPYIPDFGRFANRDPMGDKAFFDLFSNESSAIESASLKRKVERHLYSYCENATPNSYDILGLYKECGIKFLFGHSFWAPGAVKEIKSQYQGAEGFMIAPFSCWSAALDLGDYGPEEENFTRYNEKIKQSNAEQRWMKAIKQVESMASKLCESPTCCPYVYIDIICQDHPHIEQDINWLINNTKMKENPCGKTKLLDCQKMTWTSTSGPK